MFELRTLMLLIPALPLLSAIVIGLLGSNVLRSKSHYVTVLALLGSFACSLAVAAAVAERSQEAAAAGIVGFEHIESLWTWVNVPDAYTLPGRDVTVPFRVDVTLRVDGLTAMMLPMVTFIATLVALYGSGYMHGDRGYWRFFAYVSLFVFSMTMLVMVSNFLLLFVFWEAVGVCSYLLIGFWYEKPEAAAAGKKAFLVNRVGDFGFALALFLIWTTYGSLNFHDTNEVIGVFGQQRLLAQDYVGGGVATAICVLLLLGACGKSAQFPLHVWLPDAMEGPTPVSALIHAATMVTAGVYMVARCTPLFHASPDAQMVVAAVGGFTALLAGLIAVTQFDLKRVLAYSTISQLGYMFLALGTGTVAGITAAMFHLFTHAFFKALLFLGAGSVMHSMGHVIDMRRFSGLRHLMPWTHRTFLVGCLALAGVFPFAGFWSKDQIVAAVHTEAHGGQVHAEHGDGGDEHASVMSATATRSVSTAAAVVSGADENAKRQKLFCWLYWSSLFTAGLTAFYTFRAYFKTFFGKEVIPEEAGHHAHESPPIMWGPLAILAVFAFLVGFVSEVGHRFAKFLVTAPSLAYIVPGGEFHGGEFHMNIAVISSIVALVGIALAAFFYLGHQSEVEMLARWLKPLRQLSYGKFYFDEIYDWLIVRPLRLLGDASYLADKYVVDGVVNLGGQLPVWAGNVIRRMQTGLLPFYGLMMAIGMIAILGLGGLWWFGG
ncbi:MAG: NADH-quinone oxidoreductase subunit L [Planctomycetales bacterium]|nr:NADH-quinone oxidoreductase subunit L [Planctomycetales bacterium]MCA9168840.1 NADH-quinone oxidoreductase subunit L [Planctomycetales bacterium]